MNSEVNSSSGIMVRGSRSIVGSTDAKRWATHRDSPAAFKICDRNQHVNRPNFDPGPLPTKPVPRRGDGIVLRVSGFPPYKDYGRSIRNPTHPKYDRFVRLRQVGARIMRGRKWTHGAVSLKLTMYAPNFEKNKALLDYE